MVDIISRLKDVQLYMEMGKKLLNIQSVNGNEYMGIYQSRVMFNEKSLAIDSSVEVYMCT